MKRYKILITNDDGIDSPGLTAAVKAVVDLGHVTVVAPSVQQSGMGRSLTGDSAAQLIPVDYQVDGEEIEAYHCECSPAMVVKHSIEVMYSSGEPDLLISGINYGENLGTNITTSGTIGAALQASSHGIPAIAISQQTDIESHHHYTDQDWQAASHSLRHFSKLLLRRSLPRDVDVLKIDIPSDATPSTPWNLSRLAKASYYTSVFENPTIQSRIGDGRAKVSIDLDTLDPETDIYVLLVDGRVSVTPLSLDLTSRVSFSALQGALGHNDEPSCRH